ncbi:MAG: maltose alpha-D-glucosyltransferase [Methylibium sp.]|nr:maltose alpha-D-glucosyltransferase [Methylibium sp.]
MPLKIEGEAEHSVVRAVEPGASALPPLAKPNVERPPTDDPCWYKDAVIYQLHLKSFFDANNDGIGDFAGLVAKLDYIAALGVDTIWLLPFYPSPRRDDGYDIADYRGVHPDYGTMADARRFVAEAHRRGLRVITELVINHTSDQHPWFQRARAAKPGSSARNFYVWSDNDQAYAGTRIIFCDTEKSNWTWDPVAESFYWHRFYSHQPDLNFDNPQVLKAVLSVMRFWLDIGVDGLRLDAVPYLVEREGTTNENLPETHEVLRKIRATVDREYPGRMLLAEANMWPEDVQQYFGRDENGLGDQCQMAFHFPLMPRMYMAIAQEDRFPITDILRQTPDIPPNCQWAIFLRNHDELTLEMVTDKERDYLWSFYASDRRARINLGIRRRLAPLLERDRRRVELLNSLLLSMPGTPVIYYGDEIGMGDNIHLGDRDGVRTPMQWSPDRNGGFSRADPARLVLPPVMDSLYGFEAVNVEAQSADPYSLLNWMRRMLAVRKPHPAFGRGTLKLLSPANRKVLAYLREYRQEGAPAQDGNDEKVERIESILCVANVSRSSQAVELDLSAFSGRVPVEMIGGSRFPAIGQLPYLLTLPPFGFYWFSLTSEAESLGGPAPPPEAMPDYATLVVRREVGELLLPPSRAVLEGEVLPAYLPKRRWYGAKNEKIEQVTIAFAAELDGTTRPMLLTELEVRTATGTERYMLPFGFIGEDEATSPLPLQLALSRVRRGRQVGLLTDAFTLHPFVLRMLALVREGRTLATSDGEIRFLPTSRLDEIDLGPSPEVRYLSAEQSNSSVVLGEQVILKLIRRMQPGIHPEVEMGRYLTEGGFANIALTLGEVTRVAADGAPQVMAVLQKFMHNQGDAWAWTLGALERSIQDVMAEPAQTVENTPVDRESGDPGEEALAEFRESAGVLGRRLGELHVALARPSEDPAFAPEPASAKDVAAWAAGAREQLERSLALLQAPGGKRASDHRATDEEAGLAEQLLGQREALLALVDRLAAQGVGSLRTRIHGDLHLGQVLVAQSDAYFIDFEGEPLKPLAERRRKQSPLRDVAGMLRSFSYAAAVAINSGPGDIGEAAEARKRLLLERFLPASQEAFLAAYREASAGVAHDWVGPSGEAALIDLFTLEKAAYELCYESANRPAWIGVPLRGLAAIAQRLLEAEATPDDSPAGDSSQA